MINKDVMVLQDHDNSEMAVGNPCGETNPTARDASEAISIKVEEVSAAEEEAGPVPITFRTVKTEPEEVSDAEEEAGPVPITFGTVKTEPEVRYMSLYVHCRPLGL
jgi:hypothetical protein